MKCVSVKERRKTPSYDAEPVHCYKERQFKYTKIGIQNAW